MLREKLISGRGVVCLALKADMIPNIEGFNIMIVFIRHTKSIRILP